MVWHQLAGSALSGFINGLTLQQNWSVPYSFFFFSLSFHIFCFFSIYKTPLGCFLLSYISISFPTLDVCGALLVLEEEQVSICNPPPKKMFIVQCSETFLPYLGGGKTNKIKKRKKKKEKCLPINVFIMHRKPEMQKERSRNASSTLGEDGNQIMSV